MRVLWGPVTLVMVAAMLITFRLYLMGSTPPEFSPSDNPAADNQSLLTRFLTFCYLPMFNCYLLLNPCVLSFDWSMEAIPLITSIQDFRNVISLVCYLFIFVIITVTWTRSQTFSDKHRQTDVILLAFAILIIPFLLATNLFFYVGFVVAERILYIPSMGYCLLLGLSTNLFDYPPVRRKKRILLFMKLMFVYVIVLFSLRTYRRNKDWKTEEVLYRSGININPPKGKSFLKF